MTFSTQPSPLFMAALILILLANTVLGRNIVSSVYSNHNYIEEKGGGTSNEVIPVGNEKVGRIGRRANTVQVAGSSLPDCSHACGSCSPCRLVMVSFICEEEAESCPLAYKCMCNRRSYPVP
ncbi:hypothetical protein HPP92_008638 [Vanilla planifolia]|uniref:Epidermal patterning factor-like protein n=1 Tax=Vanilla planifolia TaxID=51239 RepID=A0A835RE23_VANPL|nr:hypothetical protein HPP92_008822 [Vanilla planifolia]KAG0486543.1 hypothetical protein HPP92_008638 [Vanilla planifolia]